MANDTLNEILQNQNDYIHSMEVLTRDLQQTNNSALEKLDNDDKSLTDIKNDLKSVIDYINLKINREYGYSFDPLVTEGIEEDYNRIIEAHPEFVGIPAIGQIAMLKQGTYTALEEQPDDWETNYDNYFYLDDDQYITNLSPDWDSEKEYYSYSGDMIKNGNTRMFVNGTEFNVYTYRDTHTTNGFEVVKVWYFQKNAENISLDTGFTFYNILIYYKNMYYNPITTQNYVNPTISVIDGDYKSQPFFTNYIIYKRNTKSAVPQRFNYFYSEQRTIEYDYYFLFSVSNSNTQSNAVMFFPYLEIISRGANNGAFFDNIWATVYFPKLISISGGNNQNQSVFNASGGNNARMKVTLPKTVRFIGNFVFNNNGYYDLLRLECNQAQIMTNWCAGKPVNQSFEMCSGWETTINIANAAYNWGSDRFEIPETVDLQDEYYLYNILKRHEYEPNEHIITIPSKYVTEQLVDAYREIGWDLTGA